MIDQEKQRDPSRNFQNTYFPEDGPVAGKEGQRRVRKWQLFSRRDANEIGSCCFIVLVVEQGAKVEETGECLRELLAVLRVGDESAPVAGDALESADRFDGQPRQDLDDEVIGEVSGGAGPLLGAGWVHPRPRKSIYSDPNQSPPTCRSAHLFSKKNPTNQTESSHRKQYPIFLHE